MDTTRRKELKAYADARLEWPVSSNLPQLAIATEEYFSTPCIACIPVLRDAISLYPSDLRLWAAFAQIAMKKKDVSDQTQPLTEPLMQLREELGVCDPSTQEALASFYNLLGALDKQDVAATSAALEELAKQFSVLKAPPLPERKVRFESLLFFVSPTVNGWHRPPADVAGIQLRLAGIFDALDNQIAPAKLAAEAEPFLSGVERATALFYLSEDAAIRKDTKALALAQQAAALAPYAMPIRWNLAQRLRDAGRRAEADFEFSSVLPSLNPNTRDGQEKLKEYEAFRAEGTTP